MGISDYSKPFLERKSTTLLGVNSGKKLIPLDLQLSQLNQPCCPHRWCFFLSTRVFTTQTPPAMANDPRDAPPRMLLKLGHVGGCGFRGGASKKLKLLVFPSVES